MAVKVCQGKVITMVDGVIGKGVIKIITTNYSPLEKEINWVSTKIVRLVVGCLGVWLIGWGF